MCGITFSLADYDIAQHNFPNNIIIGYCFSLKKFNFIKLFLYDDGGADCISNGVASSI